MVGLACLPQAGVWVLKLRKFLNKFIPYGQENTQILSIYFRRKRARFDVIFTHKNQPFLRCAE